MLWHDTERCFVYSWHQSWTTPVLTEYVSPSKVKIFLFCSSQAAVVKCSFVRASWRPDKISVFIILTICFSPHSSPRIFAWSWHITDLIFYLKPRSLLLELIIAAWSLIYQRQIFLKTFNWLSRRNDFDLISISWARGVCGNKRDLGRVWL